MNHRQPKTYDRRSVLRTGLGLAGGLLLPSHVLAGASPTLGRPLFASACKDRRGRLLVIIFDAESGELVQSLELPERGHGIAVRPSETGRAQGREFVTFARRPGNFAVVLDLDEAREPL